MPQYLDSEAFGHGGDTGRRQAIFTLNGGTAKLQARDEIDQVDADYVDVPESVAATDTTYTFYCEDGFIYRPVLTGSATCMISGKKRAK